MEKMFFEGGNFNKVKKIRVEDEDAMEWIAILRKGGFSNEEINSIMENLNETYAELTDPGFRYIKEEIRKIKGKTREGQGRELDEWERKYS